MEPQVTDHTITLTPSDTASTFRVQLKAYNEVGSVMSGIGSFVLADIPDAPDPPFNDASVTAFDKIKVRFAETLPNNRGNLVYAIQLAMDDGNGGPWAVVLGEDESVPTLHTSYTASQTIVKGRRYGFRCRVRNSIGWSDWSSPDTFVLAAVSPSKPNPPRLVSASATEMSL